VLLERERRMPAARAIPASPKRFFMVSILLVEVR
jgi:hypothetical protein